MSDKRDNGGNGGRGGRDERAYLSICAIFRNEAPYLREWIEFHRVVGADRFFLYDNGSEDGHMEQLEPYLDDVVVLHDWPGSARQIQAYDHCISEHGDESRWIAFIDLDEFVFSPTLRPLPEVLTGYEDQPGIGVSLALFGTSGHVTPPPGLVIENYVWRANSDGMPGYISSIVDPARVERCIGTHHFAYTEGEGLDELGRPLEDWLSKSPSFTHLQANHYTTRSKTEWLRKLARPRADDAEMWRVPRRERLDKREAFLNARLDHTIVHYVPAVRDALSRAAAGSRSG